MFERQDKLKACLGWEPNSEQCIGVSGQVLDVLTEIKVFSHFPWLGFCDNSMQIRESHGNSS